jgi:hypothetical protein
MSSVLKRRGLCLAIVALVSLLAHAKGLTAPLLDYHFHRQVNTASIARRYWREARPIQEPRIDWNGAQDRLAATELPLYMWTYGKLWPLAGLGEKWGRLISAAASLLTAILLFFFFERELGREPAFWGATIFSVLPLEAYFGRTVQPEAAALLALVGGLLLWSRALETGRPWLPSASSFPTPIFSPRWRASPIGNWDAEPGRTGALSSRGSSRWAASSAGISTRAAACTSCRLMPMSTPTFSPIRVFPTSFSSRYSLVSRN